MLRSELEVDLEGEGTVGTLLSGHQLATAAVLVQAVSYAALGLLSAPVTGSHRHAATWYRLLTPLSEQQPAALFYLLFLLGLFTWFCSGAAFILDIVRVPVLTASLAISLVFGLMGTDHYYEVYRGDGHAAPPSPAEVVHAWEQTRAARTH